ncbi:lactonase family protein [Chitinophaga sp. Cy-1792]|uniref:lactonase family protein n=1 Tax=Chitinophaga sp. Cy-1792 TaxID=2608339 RepID=UPI0014200816|nr:lactonase family protein [Chitinophaga sp. Cy-1792]NIG55560.1 lactonase family protein [Chitinophaga sp. Cy-1792]
MPRPQKLICTAILLFSAAASYAQQYYLFAGTYNKAKGQEGIYIYQFNPENGTLKKSSSVTDVVNPSYLNTSTDGRFVYAATESRIPDGGTVSAYRFDSIHGSLAFINSQSSFGENPVYVMADRANKWLLNANYTGGSLCIHPLLPDGSIGETAQPIKINYTGTLVRQEVSHVHSVGFSPDQQYVYAPDLGANRIWWYKLGSGSTPLTASTPAFTPAATHAGPRHFEFHPNGKFGYCVEEISGNVVAYKYTNGRLDSIQTIAAHNIPGLGDYGGSDIHCSPDGKFLYVSTRGDENIIVIYKADARSGQLTRISSISSGGNHPRNFVIDPTGNYLLVAHQLSDDIIIFRRDKATGLLTQTGKVTGITAPSCLKIRAYKVKS